MGAVYLIIVMISLFTHLCVDDVAPTEEAAALETPAPEADAAPEVNEETADDDETDHTAEVKNKNILFRLILYLFCSFVFYLSRGILSCSLLTN